MQKNVRIFEVFTSIEGEGILCGTKTLFVRLAGCPFTCFYCDTTEALPADSGIEYTIDQAALLIDDALQSHTYKVNFTGGDPLIQHEAVAKLAEHVHLHASSTKMSGKKDDMSKKIRTYLESSCFDSGRFAHVLPHIDIAKIEFKTSDSEFVDAKRQQKTTDEALECLRLALAAGKTTYVKVVASSKTTTEEVRKLAEAVQGIVCDTGSATAIQQGKLSGFTIQPVYDDYNSGKGASSSWAPSLQQLLAIHDAVSPIYADVRVIPQMHKMMGAP